jgi:hypothetical protein
MYEQIQSQMIQMSKQFANAALQANTLALKNAERERRVLGPGFRGT